MLTNESREIAVLALPLDTRTSVMRSEESSFGNLVADALRSELGAQFGLINGGFIRGDAGTIYIYIYI
jgi:2',3'-cyclic-nucleotide 2'-phosphodiesterase (5'-nucleotidase family)